MRFFFLLGLCLSGCTVDGDTIENKNCDMEQPAEKRCVAGYECNCEGTLPSDCFCRKKAAVSELQQPDARLK